LGCRQIAKAIGDHPGHRFLLSHTSLLHFLLPPLPGIGIGPCTTWDKKHSVYEKVGWDIRSNVSAWPKPQASFFVSDAALIKEVTTSRARFPKPVEQYSLLLIFGYNIVASEGETWKRYRKISAPAFSDQNNRLVWDETVKIMLDMFEIVWKYDDEVSIDHGMDITLPIALFVIAIAGFGRRISWSDDLNIPPGHKMAFKEALHVVSSNMVLKLIVPRWATGLNKQFRQTQLAFQELEQYMVEMIHSRRSSEKKEERYDLFSSLLDASEEEDLSSERPN